MYSSKKITHIIILFRIFTIVFYFNLHAYLSAEWTLLQPEGDIPPGRTSHTAIYRYPYNEMVIFGGFKGMQYPLYCYDIFKINLETNTWQQLPSAPIDRSDHSAIYDPIEDRMLVFGGSKKMGGVSIHTNTLYEFNFENNQWLLLDTYGNIPSQRSYHSVAYDPTEYRMIIYGGTYWGCNETYTLDLNTLEWNILSVTGDIPLETRQQAAVLDSSNNQLIVFGGLIRSNNTYCAETHVLDLNTNNWSQIGPFFSNPSERGLMAYTHSSNIDQLIIFGGYNGVRLNDIWCYNVLSDEWDTPNPTEPLPCGRNSSTLISIDNPSDFYLVLFGGYDGSIYFDELWKLEINEVSHVSGEEIIFNARLRNYPNPFNPSTTIEFSIQNDSKIELTIFNIRGQKIKTLTQNEFIKGSHSIIWNGNDESGDSVSSGIYYYKLKVNGEPESMKKCLLLK